jgi:hypothetical protein
MEINLGKNTIKVFMEKKPFETKKGAGAHLARKRDPVARLAQ